MSRGFGPLSTAPSTIHARLVNRLVSAHAVETAKQQATHKNFMAAENKSKPLPLSKPTPDFFDGPSGVLAHQWLRIVERTLQGWQCRCVTDIAECDADV